MPYLRFRRQTGPPEWGTGPVVTKPFGLGWGFGCAIVEGDKAYVFASGGGFTAAGNISMWSSDELTPAAEWKYVQALDMHPFTTFNTAVGKGVLPDGKEGFAMLIEVGGLPGGFNIVVALSESLEGPWELGDGPAPSPLPRPLITKPCTGPVAGYCEAARSTPTHVAAGVLASGPWPHPTSAAAQAAVGKLCDANKHCAAFGLMAAGRSYQLYPRSPTVLHPLFTKDWTLFYKNASCCAVPAAPPPSPPPKPKLARVFGPGSCPALRYDAASGYWHMLYTPNPTVSGGDYRTWQVYAARSRTLATGSWEHSTLNPVMEADAFDRQLHNKNIPPEQHKWAETTENLNDSDADLVEFEGKVLFVGNWGDQRTTPTNSLYQAVFDGTMAEFWASLYPPTSGLQNRSGIHLPTNREKVHKIG
jgi:hypothetical protein